MTTRSFTSPLQQVAFGALALIVSGTALLAVAGPAKAEPARAALVQVSDLDLGTPSGRMTAEARIRSAARRVCDAGAPDLSARTMEKLCISNAMAGARIALAARSDLPMLAVINPAANQS